MLDRGISEETCRLYNIVNSPEPDKADRYILMPFVDSEGTTVTYAKYRNLYPEADSNGKMQPKEKEVMVSLVFLDCRIYRKIHTRL